MKESKFDMDTVDIVWCPGCGNFSILKALKGALSDLDVEPGTLVMVSGIGQAAKIPYYVKAHVFNGLHGRALPPATAIKAANPELTVIAAGGDGDMYGEGGNHFLHTLRRNPDITNIVHNNMVYGLTKGQASPTSRIGFTTPVQVGGVTEEPMNAIAIAIAQDASFVARAFSGDMDGMREILRKAIAHKGYALVEILQNCVSFNKVNTLKWFKQKTYCLDDSHDPTDRAEAFRHATEKEKLPLGVFYINPDKPCFEETLPVYRRNREPLFQRTLDSDRLAGLVESKRGG